MGMQSGGVHREASTLLKSANSDCSTKPQGAHFSPYDVVLWGATLLLFWPATAWLARQALDSEQILHAFIVMMFALVFLVRENGWRPVWAMQRWAFSLLLSAYGLMGVAMIFGWAEPVFLSYCLLAAAALSYVYGDRAHRLALSLLGAFAVFVVLIFTYPLLDWPLRTLAGRLAKWVLGHIGQTAELGVLLAGAPKLLLSVNTHLFEVATECNGFGLLGGSLVLAVLLLLYRPGLWLRKIAVLAIAILCAITLNVLRIVVISLLAPHVGTHYLLMHEAVGMTLFVSGLILVWCLAGGRFSKYATTQVDRDLRARSGVGL